MERAATQQPRWARTVACYWVKKKAADGLPARTGRIWTREKLTYLQKYASAFMTAMGPKRSEGKWDKLVYIDLLAGPGRDIDPDSSEEFDGSPLIALAVRPKFDHLYLADEKSRNITALRARIPAEDISRATVMSGDCNVLVDQVIAKISARTLGLAFIDPQGFEVHFDTLAKLAKRRIDLLYLFPSGIGVRRNWRQSIRSPKSKFDKFWGGSDWQQLPVVKQATGDTDDFTSDKILRSFIVAFREKLRRAGFEFQDEAVPQFTNTRNAQMYHLLFCSHGKMGLDLWNKIKKIAPDGQRGFLFP